MNPCGVRGTQCSSDGRWRASDSPMGASRGSDKCPLCNAASVTVGSAGGAPVSVASVAGGQRNGNAMRNERAQTLALEMQHLIVYPKKD